MQESLKNLQLDNVDLLYLHWPACPPSESDEILHKPVHFVWEELE